MTDWTTTDFHCSKCGAWKGQLGLEPTFDLYIKHLCDIFDEVKRVLRDDGTCWVNIGDTYNAGGNYRGKELDDNSKEVYRRKDFEGCKNNPKEQGVPAKCLLGIPMRFAIEMINRGWILRNTIIWHKRNCMPCSVKDRFTVDFEYIFFFSKKKKYYFETIYEPLADITLKDPRLNKGGFEYNGKRKGIEGIQNRMCGMDSSKGRNKRTVWTINPKPFKESHFAVYPEELCETPIKAGCPKFVCVKCGNPKVLEIERKTKEVSRNKRDGDGDRAIGGELQKFKDENPDIIKGYKPTCKCNAGFTSGIVLDPFFGAGTTGVVALKQNKKFIGIELNPEYIEIAKKRLKPFLEQRKLI